MKTRILTGCVGVPIVLLCLFWSRWLMIGLVLLLMLISQYELSKMYQKSGGKTIIILPFLTCISMMVMYLLNLTQWTSISFALFFIIMAIWIIYNYPHVKIADMTFSLFMCFYGGWTFMHIFVLYDHARGNWLLLMLFSAVWLSDSGAYFVGKFFGKRKMSPKLSPNKTIEGALGGILIAMLGICYMNKVLLIFPSWISAIIFAFIVSFFGIFGDLFESYLKRVMNVKDSGKILPGHGGILDRFDSFIFVAPLCSYVLAFLYSI